MSIKQLIQNVLGKGGSEGEIRRLTVESAQSPADLRLKLQLGKLYFKKKDSRNGIVLYREVAERYTQDEFYLKAIAVYKELLRYSPSSIEFNEKLGDLFLKLGMVPDALRQYQIVFFYYRNHKQSEAAIRTALKMISAAPERSVYRLRLAELYVNQGLEEEAYQQYLQVADQIKGQEGELETLVDVYEKILIKHPEDRPRLQALMEGYLKLAKPQKVLRRLERLKLQQDPQFKPLYEAAQTMKPAAEENS